LIQVETEYAIIIYGKIQATDWFGGFFADMELTMSWVEKPGRRRAARCPNYAVNA
jgi:hypothetical protein